MRGRGDQDKVTLLQKSTRKTSIEDTEISMSVTETETEKT